MTPSAIRVASRHLAKSPGDSKHKPGDVWRTGGGWRAMSPSGTSRTFHVLPQAKSFAKGTQKGKAKGEKEAPKGESKAPKRETPKGPKKLDPKHRKVVQEYDRLWKTVYEGGPEKGSDGSYAERAHAQRESDKKVKRMNEIIQQVGARNLSEMQELVEQASQGRKAQDHSEWIRIFDGLKPGQTIQVAMKSVMGMGSLTDGNFHDHKVGRKSRSKKYGTETISLLPMEGPIPPRYARFTLNKRNDSITAAHGDMAVMLKGLKRG